MVCKLRNHKYLSDFSVFRINTLKLYFDNIEEYDFAYEKGLTQALTRLICEDYSLYKLIYTPGYAVVKRKSGFFYMRFLSVWSTAP